MADAAYLIPAIVLDLVTILVVAIFCCRRPPIQRSAKLAIKAKDADLYINGDGEVGGIKEKWYIEPRKGSYFLKHKTTGKYLTPLWSEPDTVAGLDIAPYPLWVTQNGDHVTIGDDKGRILCHDKDGILRFVQDPGEEHTSLWSLVI